MSWPEIFTLAVLPAFLLLDAITHAHAGRVRGWRSRALSITVVNTGLALVVGHQRGRVAHAGKRDAARARAALARVAIRRLLPAHAAHLAEAREGANTFRVEAALDAPPQGLRPGMEGAAKLEVGEARLVWVWSRRMVDWARRTLWTWQP